MINVLRFTSLPACTAAAGQHTTAIQRRTSTGAYSGQVISSSITLREALGSAPVQIGMIIVGAFILALVLRFIIARVVRQLSRVKPHRIDMLGSAQVRVGSAERTPSRLRTFQSVANSTISLVVGIVAALMVLTSAGVNIAPLLASAGVVGVALAFGAQALVKDALSGVFMLVEDQYGVGDRVELGTGGSVLAEGTVESVGLRITSVRDDDGRLWYVRNGEIVRVSNESQGWSQAVARVQVSQDCDLGAVREAFEAVTGALRSDTEFGSAILGDPEFRVEDISGTGVTIQWRVRTAAGRQINVASAFRHQVVTALNERGVTLA